MPELNTTFKQKANAVFINETFTCETIARMHETMVRLYEAARTLKKLETPTDVARALNQSQQTINNWERRGMSRIGMIEAQKLIGCSATWLQTGAPPMTTAEAAPHLNGDADTGLKDRIQTILNDTKVDVPKLAKSAGVAKDTVNRWLSGDLMSIKLDQAVGIQDAYGYNAVWIVMGKGPMKAAIYDDPRPPAPQKKAPKPKKASPEAADPTPLTYLADVAKYRAIPVVGRAQGGLPDRIWTDGDYPVGATEQYAEIASADPHAFLTPVVGVSMIPRYNPGEFALVEPGTEPELEDDVLVRLKTGETMIKRLLSRRQGIRLGSYNDPETFTFEPTDITWMYYIAHPVPARKIKTRL